MCARISMAAGLLKNFIVSFFSKIGEKLADYGLEKVTRKKDSKFMLKTLEISLNSLSDKACDINEQIRHGELSGTKKRKREVENWLKKVKKMESELGVLQNEVQEEGFLGRFFGEDRVSELNARVCELVEQCRHFGEVLFVAHEMRGEPLLTARLIGEEFMENTEVILEWLVIDEVKSIGIYGMGGVGKTTLAKHINNRLLKETQCSVFWVSVSQVFTINKLQSDIAKVIGLDLSDEINEDKRAGRINQALSQKNFVLILDDVWSDIDLEKLGDPLGVKGCKLIVTTRSLTVCHRINCQEIIKVETLQTDESWTLFRETLGKRTTITSEVEEIAKCVAKQCDGLPLGIIVLAKSMKGVTDIHEWRNVYNEICESPMELDDMKGNVFRVLKYSFIRLDPDFHEKGRRRNGYAKLQLCFLYCSLYPEDYAIKKDELIRKFISEELVDIRKSREKQLDQGYTMLSKLVNLCLIEPIYGLDGESFECVTMHDLVRDMALEIVTESPKHKVFGGLGLKKIPNEEEWTEDVEKMSLMLNDIVEIPKGMAPNCPKLATLLLNENPLESIPESFFTQMISNLHILDLSRTRIQELPNSLLDLENLKTLLLNNCEDLVSLPFLGKLKALRELDLSGTSIEKMPKGMENLINLKILLFRGTKNLKLQPGDLSLISPYLQHLELPFEIEAPIHEIVEFKQLKIFVGSFKEFSDFDWFQLQTGGLITNFHYNVGIVDDDYVEDNNTLTNISILSMYKCSLRREGEDGVIILPENTRVLEIQNCKGLSSCILGDLKSCPSFLEKLRIVDCEGIESILNINDQFLTETPIRIGSFDLTGLPDLKGLVNWEVGGAPPPSLPPQAALVFSSIQQLSIFGCNNMKTLGLPLPFFENIESIDIGFCGELEELIQLVERDDDEGISQLTVPLPNLKRLHLLGLPKLKSICKASVDCNSIEEIEILMCPLVKKLPLFLSSSSDGQVINYYPPPALRRIDIEKERWESLKWDDLIHKHLLQPFVIYPHQHTN